MCVGKVELFGVERFDGDVEGEGGAEDCEGGEFHVGFAVFYFAEGSGSYAGGFGEAAQRHATREACQADFVANVDAEVTDDGFFCFGCQHGLFPSDFGYRSNGDVIFTRRAFVGHERPHEFVFGFVVGYGVEVNADY